MNNALLELQHGQLIDVIIGKTLPFGTLVSEPSGIAGLLSGEKKFDEGSRFQVRVADVDATNQRFSAILP